MADNWYYVQKGNRQGPVDLEVIAKMVQSADLNLDDFVWKKGFENWKKIREVDELQSSPQTSQAIPQEISQPIVTGKEINLSQLGPDDRIIYVRIGNDRGDAAANTDYGPFNISQIKQLFKENRINGKTFIFATGMKEWKVLAEFPEYESLFHEVPPKIQEADKRTALRKPFIARLFIQNNKKLFEGICRDISIGGMQVLLDHFNGNAGDKITINVHPENSEYHFVAAGEIVRMLEGNSGFSFRFHGLTDEAKRAIEKYVQDN